MNSKFQCFLKDMYDDIQISKNAKKHDTNRYVLLWYSLHVPFVTRITWQH